MSDFPLQALAIPAFALGAVVVQLIRRRGSMRALDQTYATYRAGEMARRLGLDLMEGDPAFNLFIQQANAEVDRGPRDGQPVHIRLRMVGAPQGVPMDFVYDARVERERGFGEVVDTTWFECRLRATAARPFPPFEVITRQAPLGPIATKQALPAAATGNAQVDAEYAVTTHEPALARLLGELLPQAATFRNAGLHVVGDGQHVAFHMRRDKAPLLANVLYYAEDLTALLGHFARRVGGSV